VRVPAFIVSPFVERGTVFSEPLDHTSLLGLLADRFTPGEAYSEAVARRSQLLSRLANALTLAEPRADFPAPPPRGPSVPSLPSEAVDASARAEGAESNAGAFREAFVTTVENHPIAAVELLPSGAHLIESP
jgi:phospholipase C